LANERVLKKTDQPSLLSPEILNSNAKEIQETTESQKQNDERSEIPTTHQVIKPQFMNDEIPSLKSSSILETPHISCKFSCSSHVEAKNVQSEKEISQQVVHAKTIGFKPTDNSQMSENLNADHNKEKKNEDHGKEKRKILLFLIFFFNLTSIKLLFTVSTKQIISKFEESKHNSDLRHKTNRVVFSNSLNQYHACTKKTLNCPEHCGSHENIDIEAALKSSKNLENEH
jgi:hypothetical protein